MSNNVLSKKSCSRMQKRIKREERVGERRKRGKEREAGRKGLSWGVVLEYQKERRRFFFFCIHGRTLELRGKVLSPSLFLSFSVFEGAEERTRERERE